MSPQTWPRRALLGCGRVVGYFLGVVGLCLGVFVVTVARHQPTGATWPATYVQFLSGSTDLPVEFFVPVVSVLFSLALIHAVYRENVAFLTFAPAVILLRFGATVTVDTGIVPLLGVVSSRSGPEADTVVIPTWAAVLLVGAVWNVDDLLGNEAEVTESESAADGVESTNWAEQRWRLTTVVSGYTLAGILCALGVWMIAGTSATLLGNTGVGLLAFGAVVYEVVSTDSLYGTATLATWAWITGLAALQYDGALQGVALPVAVLLTLAAGGLWLDGRSQDN